jgi:hypothetical protein
VQKVDQLGLGGSGVGHERAGAAAPAKQSYRAPSVTRATLLRSSAAPKRRLRACRTI